MAAKVIPNDFFHRNVGLYRLRTSMVDWLKSVIWKVLGHSKSIQTSRDILNRSFMQELEDMCRGKSVLELGCGQGFMLEMTRLWGAGRQFGIDASDSMLYFARMKFKDTPYVKGDCSSLPFRDNSFDVVFCVSLLHHLLPATRKRTLEEALRVGKRFIILDNRNFQAAVPRRLAQLFWKLTDAATQNYTMEEWLRFLSNVKIERLYVPNEGGIRQFFVRVSSKS